MNRQETIIRIAKINRFVKQLNYWCELGMEINLEVFGDGLYEIDRWVAEVHEYLRENPVTILVGRGCRQYDYNQRVYEHYRQEVACQTASDSSQLH